MPSVTCKLSQASPPICAEPEAGDVVAAEGDGLADVRLAQATGDGSDRCRRQLDVLRQVGNENYDGPAKVHVNAALNAGAGREEAAETLLNLVPHIGYPEVQRSLALAKAISDERGA